jgi:hypothetical protein
MNKEQALDYCYKNRTAYIDGFLPSEDPVEQFDCLITVIEYDDDTEDFTNMLAAHGMCDEDL